MDTFKRFSLVAFFVSILPLSLVIGEHLFSDARRYAPSGTFQVICPPNIQPVFSGNYMDSLRFEIEAKRDAEKVVMIELTQDAKVMILPGREVESRTFHPVAEFIDGSVKKISFSESMK